MPAARKVQPVKTVISPNITRCLESFILALDAAGRATHTLYNYRISVEQFAQASGNPPISDVTSEDVNRYVIALRDAGKKPNTLSSRYRALVSFFRWAERTGLIERTPTAGTKAPRVPETEPPGFTRDEIMALLEQCDPRTKWGARNRAIIYVLLGTALRVSELIQLRKADVESRDSTRRYIHVMGKGSRERTISLVPEAAEALSLYLLRRGDDEYPELWVGKFGPFSVVGVQQMLKDIGVKAGLKGVHPHKWRNTALSEMLDARMPSSEVMRIAGHRSDQMLRRYVAYSQERRANDALQAANHIGRLNLNEKQKRRR